MHDLTGRRVLVTGAGGFIGANLVRALLASGAHVSGVVRPGTAPWRLAELEGELELEVIHAGVEVPGIPGPAAGAVLPASARSATFRTSDEAMQVMLTAQDAYQNAAAYLAAQDTTQHFNGLSTEAFRTRLSALDEMAAASRSALYRAPQDPLLNQYYLAFQAAREQTLQQIAVSLPAGRQMGRY